MISKFSIPIAHLGSLGSKITSAWTGAPSRNTIAAANEIPTVLQILILILKRLPEVCLHVPAKMGQFGDRTSLGFRRFSVS